ncbi:MAG: Kelch repeat-containing protein [Deltaproteobacteria bacterium]
MSRTLGFALLAMSAVAVACAPAASPPTVRLAVELILPDSPAPTEVAALRLGVSWNGGDAGVTLPAAGLAGSVDLPLPSGPVDVEIDGLDDGGVARWRGLSLGVVVPSDADAGPAVAAAFFGKIGDFSSFRSTAPMPALAGSSAVSAGRGQVLVFGGRDATGAVSDGIWLYDQRSVHLSDAGTLNHARAHALALGLSDLAGAPYVLLAGGQGIDGRPTASVELYQPSGERELGPLSAPQLDPRGAALDDGGLEVAIGCGAGAGTPSLDLYAPAGTLAGLDAGPLGPVALPGSCALGVLQLLPSLGAVAVGDLQGGGLALLSPVTGAAPWGSSRQRSRGGAAPAGQALFQFGGYVDGGVVGSAELDDGDGGVPSSWPLLATARADFATLPLPGGGLLAVGGAGEGGAALASAELVDFAAGVAVDAGSLGVARIHAALADIPGFRAALVVSGEAADGSPAGGLEIYSYP